MNSVFGGSLYSVYVLAGWALIFGRLQRTGFKGHIVIQKSEIEYLKPVTEYKNCRVQFKLSRNGSFSTYLKAIERRGRARIIVDSEITSQNERLVRFSGNYVIHN